jgi:hypothetical protein
MKITEHICRTKIKHFMIMQVPMIYCCCLSYSGGRDKEYPDLRSATQIDHEAWSCKYPTQERAGGVAQVLEHLTSKHEALSSGLQKNY